MLDFLNTLEYRGFILLLIFLFLAYYVGAVALLNAGSAAVDNGALIFSGRNLSGGVAGYAK